jgi:ketosteroid isomerase-like protein
MPADHAIIDLFQIINRRDLERFSDLLTEEAEFYFPKTQPLLGRDRIIRFFKILFRQYPKLAFEVQGEIIQGQKAAVHWTNQGIHKSGAPYENEGVTILELEGDKIRYMSDFFKDTSF